MAALAAQYIHQRTCGSGFPRAVNTFDRYQRGLFHGHPPSPAHSPVLSRRQPIVQILISTPAVASFCQTDDYFLSDV
jgi:hypothetical protein